MKTTNMAVNYTAAAAAFPDFFANDFVNKSDRPQQPPIRKQRNKFNLFSDSLNKNNFMLTPPAFSDVSQ